MKFQSKPIIIFKGKKNTPEIIEGHKMKRR